MAAVHTVLETILSHMETIANAKTVLGEAVQVGDRTVVPVVKVSLGFGAGGNEASEKNPQAGGGGGGGLSIAPVGFIVIEGEKTAFLPVKPTSVNAITEMIPNLLEKIVSRKSKKQAEEIEVEELEED